MSFSRHALTPSLSLVVLLCATSLRPAPSLAQGADPASRVIDCAGGDATVTGDGREVTLHGACRSLTVRGNANRIEAELAPRARVDVQGDGNQVRFRLIGGTEEARVSVAGRDDVVGPDAAPVAGEAAAATRAPLTLAEGAPSDANCTDRDVNVTGNGLTLTLHGGCRSLTVVGQGTTVNAEMQPQSRISVPGQNDKVFWYLRGTGPLPVIAERGPGSDVLQQQRLGSVIAAPSAAPADTGSQPPLQFTGGSGVVQQRCDGQDANITADNTTFVLRGRCRNLSVTGSGDKVEAEMLSGSRIRIEGDNSVVQFALVDTGPDPIVSVAGDKSTAYRIQRLGATSRADASVGVSPTAGGMSVVGGKGASVTEMPAVPQPTQPQ